MLLFVLRDIFLGAHTDQPVWNSLWIQPWSYGTYAFEYENAFTISKINGRFLHLKERRSNKNAKWETRKNWINSKYIFLPYRVPLNVWRNERYGAKTVIKVWVTVMELCHCWWIDIQTLSVQSISTIQDGKNVYSNKWALLTERRHLAK